MHNFANELIYSKWQTGEFRQDGKGNYNRGLEEELVGLEDRIARAGAEGDRVSN